VEKKRMMKVVGRDLHTLFSTGVMGTLSDGQLLDRFVEGRDGAVFEAIVRRHGPMVWGVCRRVLRDHHDAEDAFQATFLVLARRAAAVMPREKLGNWLYGVAYQVAMKARAMRAKRRMREGQVSNIPEPEVASHDLRDELAESLDGELSRLPAKYRIPIVLCDLEGRTYREAARQLGWPIGTVSSRLSRGRAILAKRLARRGLSFSVGSLAVLLAQESASASACMPTKLIGFTVRAASLFAVGGATTEGLITVEVAALTGEALKMMFLSTLKALAIASGLGVVLAAGSGAATAVGLGLASHDGGSSGETAPVPQSPPRSQSGETARAEQPSPAEQYRTLVRHYDEARAAHRKLGEKARTQAEAEAAYKDHPAPEGEFTPRFFALAERYPNDPIAVDALVWVVERSMTHGGHPDGPMARMTGRAMTILSRDHSGDPRLGPACLKLAYYPSPDRDAFLRTVAERSPDRIARGRATLALAQYLKMKGELVQTLKKAATSGGYDEGVILGMYGREYLGQLRAAEPSALLRESGRLFAKVDAEYGDVPHASIDDRPTNETLAEVVHPERRVERPVPTIRREGPHQAIENAYNVANLAAGRAGDEARKADPPAESVGRMLSAWSAAYPKWRDYGRKMWRLLQDSPRDPSTFDALIWLVWVGPHFRDDLAERDAVLFQVVDLLIQDHLDAIAAHLTDPNVAYALNSGDGFPARHRDRLLRALFERCRDRPTRGRMGLALARYLKAEATFVESLARHGADPRRRPEIALFDPADLERLAKADHQAIARQAQQILERVIADYGDVRYVNGKMTTQEILAVVAGRELSAMRTLTTGRPAPEIAAADLDGKPMKLSEFRGKVVLLEFGSHENCPGCRLAYPLLRSALERWRGRPFVILGINTNCSRDALKESIARGEITWRCWWEANQTDGPGPITTSWNIRGFPTFFLIDHRGVIRSKEDIHPFDTKSFDEAVDRLLKEAEAVDAQR
jgi:RNA polymerase sigma factor (sigma-70 family)